MHAGVERCGVAPPTNRNARNKTETAEATRLQFSEDIFIVGNANQEILGITHKRPDKQPK